MGSPAQKSKLRNGHKVRIKHGAGFNVIVNPNTFGIVSRAFLKNKGISLQLTPEELEMNKTPSPEMQQQIMGHNQHMVIPGVIDHINMGGRGLGTGIGDFFNNLGNQIKSGFENNIVKPAETGFNQYVKPAYDQYIKPYEGDIKKVGKVLSPGYAATDAIMRLRNGDKIQDIARDYKNDFMDVNNAKNRIIKSSPILTEAYKKGVPAVAGLATGAIGSAFGLSPVTGALLGAAGAKGADELLKAEGYGLHHLVEMGMHKYHKLKKHRCPIEGGTIGKGSIMDFFKHAGNKVKAIATYGGKQVANLNNAILNNTKLGKLVREHGSKLAGLLAKEGVKYITGDEKLGEFAGNLGTELGNKGLKKAGYGEERKVVQPVLQSRDNRRNPYNSVIPSNHINHSTQINPTTPVLNTGLSLEEQRRLARGEGLYAGSQRGYGLYSGSPPAAGGSIIHHFGKIGNGFHSFDSLHNAAMGYAKANDVLARLSDRTIYGQHYADPIKRYWDADGEPRSRGTGIHHHHHGHHHGKVHHMRKAGYEHHNHYNLVRGRGTLLEHKSHLPPALQSQPYGSNFHMQNMLPPQYQKYNDGTNEY
jgi:hypothetical protein